MWKFTPETYSAARKSFLGAGLDIDKAFAEGAARGNGYELREQRAKFFNRYIRLLDQVHQHPRDYFHVWLGCVQAFRAYVRNPYVVKTGVSRLQRWWRVVQENGRFDQRAIEAADTALGELEEMLNALSVREMDNKELIEQVAICKEGLGRSIEEYVNSRR